LQRMKYGRHGVRVGHSPHGLGVFSLRRFAADEWLGPIEGRVVDDAHYESDYCMELGEQSALEPDPPFRYVNHSCHPNCELIQRNRTEDADHPRLWLQAKTTLAPGEELTIDYAWPAEVATRCHCGCPDCRRWIVARDQLEQAQHGAARE
jgi:uncharacterized protein